MFKRVLIANRGEIAVAITRACREMNIETVAVYSTEDENSLAVQFANESVCIGGPRSSESYLNMENILSAATLTNCDAIHPGFGFLSENAAFVRLCDHCGITFIGPRAETIESMGNKASARELMKSCGVPVVPGSDGAVDNVDKALAIAEEVGFPVLVKASAGGGGRGMRRCYDVESFREQYAAARSEALACFGDDEMYVEKLIEHPKHIEFQIMADTRGNVVQLGERDCSIQRNNQKLLEESPSPSIDSAMREKMGTDAITAAKAVGYVGAGTIEFVVADGLYYFIEMNTRIQVEHPVTEMVTGCNLIKEQMRIAAGLSISFSQDDICPEGHAIECRINAEDPANGFRPCPGTIGFLHLPGGNGTRVDTALYNGYEMSPFYDSMAAKVIVWAPSRLEAIRKMRRALEEMTIEGLTTNLEFQHLILFNQDFLKGDYDTSFIEKNMDDLLALDDSTRRFEVESSYGFQLGNEV